MGLKRLVYIDASETQSTLMIQSPSIPRWYQRILACVLPIHQQHFTYNLLQRLYLSSKLIHSHSILFLFTLDRFVLLLQSLNELLVLVSDPFLLH